ncbi:MAG: tetratricopeptide repeat protein, partial [Chloroflexi bacterium]|nr:tetratricopeptide repeat protein [Chloroflexota bacterium]
HYLCLALLETADLAGAEQEAAEQRRLARELQQPAQLFYVMTVDSMLATLQGRFEEAERLMPDALRMGQRAESAMAAIYGLFQRYDLARHRGGAAELLPELRELAAAYPTYVVAQSLIADALLRADRAADARAALRRLGADRFAVLPLNDEWLFAVTVLADVAVDLGEADLCRALHELLLPYSERVAVSAPDTCLGAVARTLGRLSATLGRSADARDHLERALTINQQLRSRPWVARTRHDLARLIAAAGDAQGAERLLEATITEATALGMEPLHADSVHLLGQIRSQPGAPQELAFLFTDIVGSTELMTAIGDAAWARLVAWHDDTLRALLAAYRGREVHHAGDGFFVVFDAADAAIACAKAIQRRLAEQRHDHGFAPDVRVGVHTATARVTRGDYQGRGVHQAARLAALASAGEILVSRSTLDRAGGGPTRDERVVELKGFREPVAVASIDWQTPDAVSAP